MENTLKTITHEIIGLEQDLCYANFISDVASVITRDITGGALELQHHSPNNNPGPNAPYRPYLQFRDVASRHSSVIAAARKASSKLISSNIRKTHVYFFRTTAIGLPRLSQC